MRKTNYNTSLNKEGLMGQANQMWDAELYDQNHRFVSQYGNSLVDLFQPKEGEKVLDLGCGTGDLAYDMYQRGADVVGIDASKEMIRSARNKYPQLTFYERDANNIDLDTQFQGVFSNAVLHWIKTPDRVLKSVHNVLCDGGRFVVEFGGKDNCKTIIDAMLEAMESKGLPYGESGLPWYFPSIGEYTSLMEQEGFYVSYAIHYQRPTKLMHKEAGMRNWIRMFTSKLYAHIPEEHIDILIRDVQSRIREKLFREGRWYADYRRIRVVAYK